MEMFKKYAYSLSLTIIFLLNSCGDPKLDKNEQNLKKVKVNMTVLQVEALMGKPDAIFTEANLFRYMYKAPSGMSDDFYIFFSQKDSIVISINDGL